MPHTKTTRKEPPARIADDIDADTIDRFLQNDPLQRVVNIRVKEAINTIRLFPENTRNGGSQIPPVSTPDKIDQMLEDMGFGW